ATATATHTNNIEIALSLVTVGATDQAVEAKRSPMSAPKPTANGTGTGRCLRSEAIAGMIVAATAPIMANFKTNQNELPGRVELPRTRATVVKGTRIRRLRVMTSHPT